MHFDKIRGVKALFLFLLFFATTLPRADAKTYTSVNDRFNHPPLGNFSDHDFSITGQVMLISNDNPNRLNIIDRNYPFTLNFHDLCKAKSPYRSGDIVHVKGTFVTHRNPQQRESSAPFADCITNIAILGHLPLPKTHEVSARQVNDGSAIGQFIHVNGIISSIIKDPTNIGWNWIILRTDTGKVRAAVTEHDHPYDDLIRHLDAEATVRGIAHEFGPWRQFLGFHIILYGENGITITMPAPDPFSAPKHSDRSTNHRQLVRGKVLGLSRNKVFLESEDEGFLPLTPAHEGALPSIGDQVTASGFLDYGPMGFLMSEAIIRTDKAPTPATNSVPQSVDPEAMFSTAQGKDVADSSLYGKLIRLSGRIANSTEGIRTDGKIILECGKRTISVDVAHLLGTIDRNLGTGCIIDVSGICLSDFDADVTNLTFPRFKGFVIVPRTAGDIVIVKRPPWWTVGKLLCVIAVLTLGLVAFFIWNRMLKVLSERRGRELAEEQIESARSDLKVEERTRLAIELHDSISQTLTGVALQIDAATKTGKANPSAAERFLGTARTMLASCRQELRCCIWDLKSRTFDEKDMTEAVQKTLAPHVGDTELHVRFNVPRSILSESATHDTLRIVRELAVNALRHGQARHLRVAGEHKDGYVRFSVQDDGKGFDPATLPGPADGHFGLQGIRERVKNRNGELHIESAVGTGTKVTVTLLADEKDEDEK